MGFNPAEIEIMNSENAGCFEPVTFGAPTPLEVLNNHDVLTYLKQDAFGKALAALLKAGV